VSLRLALAAAAAAASLALALVLAGPAGAAPPAIRAPAAILFEPATGDVVFQRQADSPRPIASTTKLMTALLTLENARLSQSMTAVRYRPSPAESVVNLRAGERLTVADLLRALLMASANDAAATLATRIGGSERAFVATMNRRARELGLHETHYENPIGLDAPDNHSSAADLVKLTLILRRNAFFRAVTDKRSTTLESGSHPRTIVNRNTLVQAVRQVNGVKTGHTNSAGYILVGSATSRGVTVISVVLDEPSESARDADSLALLRYGLRRYHRVSPVRRGQGFAAVPLAHRGARAELVAARTVTRTARRSERLTTTLRNVPRELEGPLPAGARVGTIEVRWRGHIIARVPLVARDAVGAASLWQRADDLLGWTVAVALGVVALASLQLVLLRRRAVRRRRREAGPTSVA
jgi:serine-type D-Ala-D-Ala carboxypeptidase (penicillin-binding protein 5/6)